ncbi:MAG TPA: hydrogenase nickel incorporation protein HypB, partial [Geobacteraceae bacterium]|nr:hydrogenase nickel incorporation protein HypB [Geobacteraceae bacterium]
MCTTCGCPADTHDHHHHHHHEGHHHHERPSVGERLSVEIDILAKNNRLAAGNRRFLQEKGVFALNLVSSPGSGKTTILERTLRDLSGSLRCAVIEGDQQTDNDARRIAATGVPAKQINTGAGCHLDAHMVGHAMEELPMTDLDILFIENVGNLVCPASFDLGEAHKVVVLSVTEGEDKPLKYPQMFHAADVMLLNKIDLLPYLDFDVEKCLEMARRVSPGIRIFQLSAKSGAGMVEWYEWLGRKQ